MNKLIQWFLDNPMAANLATFAIIGGGILAIPNIDKEFFPSTPLNVVEIVTPYPGAAPINVEQQVCIRIEQAIEDISGIDRITTEATQNQCSIQVEAEDNYDFDTLLDDINVQVDSLTTLPIDAEKPQVTQLNVNHEMMEIALTADLSEANLKRYAHHIKDEMESLPHVSTVTLKGVRDYEIAIELDRNALLAYQLSFQDIKNAIASSSLEVPSGTIESSEGDILLQTRNQSYTAYQYGNTPIRSLPDGTVIYLKDIATLSESFKGNMIYSRFNGKPAVFLRVEVSNNPDVIKTNNSVKAYLDKKNAELPPGIALTIWHDFSRSFKDRINTLVTNGVSGLILVFIVLMLFLRPLLAIWVSLGIAIAFFGALWVMPAVGASLNMISLFAFLLILGIIVDDAIIVGESIYSEQQRSGMGKDTASIGTKRVFKPVFFAVTSTMLFFAPMLFLPGSSAEAAKAIPTVVLLALLFSLIECLFILPSHLADMPEEGRFKNRLSTTVDKLRNKFSRGMDYVIEKIYAPMLKRCLAHFGATVTGFTAIMMIVLSIFIGGWLEYGFLPNVTTDYIRLQIELPDGEPESLKLEIANRVEAASQQLQANTLYKGTEDSYISDYLIHTSGNTVFAALGLDRTHRGTISSEELVSMWRERVGEIPQAQQVDYFYQINSEGKPLQYVLSASNNESLKSASLLLQEYLSQFAGVFDVGDSLQTPRSEIEFHLTPSAHSQGWTVQQLGEQIRSSFYGIEVQRTSRDGEDIPVMLRLADHESSEFESIYSVPVTNPSGQLVRADTVSTIHFKPALQDIERIDGNRTVIVSADLLSGTSDPMDISNQVLIDFVAQLHQRYPDVSLSLGGVEEARREFMSAWGLLFIPTLMAIYTMMAIAFRSYWQPVIIMTAIPFGIMGAILGHLIMGKEVSIFSFLGIMACAGVVVNDNLVLIDRINQLKDAGMRATEAVFKAGQDRFRPIILTSVTTFVGLIPIMSETSLQAQFLIPMVISLAYGVLFATSITLLLVPALYLMGDVLRYRAGRRTNRLIQRFVQS